LGLSANPKPSIKMSRRKIYSFHININVGDSAIHLLVDESTAIPTIKKAVLIDGGLMGQHYQRIDEVIDWINNEARARGYQFDPTEHFGDPPTLRFDAIVITHWDRDHWGGVRDLLNAGYKAQIAAHAEIIRKNDESLAAFEAAKRANTDPNKMWSEREVLAFDAIGNANGTVAMESRYMKYGVNEADRTTPIFPAAGAAVPTVAQCAPLTTFYVPYQFTTKIVGDRTTGGNKVVLNGNGKNVGPPITANVAGEKRHVVFGCNRGAPYDPVTTTFNTLDLGINYKYTILWPVSDVTELETKVEKEFTFVTACKLVANYPGYIGTELLTGVSLRSRPGTHRWNTIRNPQQLLTAHGWTPGSGPGIFVVAGAQKIIGNTPLAFNTTAADPLDAGLAGIIDSTITAPRLNDISRPGGHDTNSASICCVVLVATGNPTAKDSFKVRHYFAGDATWDVERGIAVWLTALDQNQPCKTAFMKMSQ
jgi:hypothetical protein